MRAQPTVGMDLALSAPFNLSALRSDYDPLPALHARYDPLPALHHDANPLPTLPWPGLHVDHHNHNHYNDNHNDDNHYNALSTLSAHDYNLSAVSPYDHNTLSAVSRARTHYDLPALHHDDNSLPTLPWPGPHVDHNHDNALSTVSL